MVLNPLYRPWAEIYGINPRPIMGVKYFGSDQEDALLKLISRSFGPGEKIYVEYYEDNETSNGLTYGFPPVTTRLGYKLFGLGFMWYKDWYLPKDGLEGIRSVKGKCLWTM